MVLRDMLKCFKALSSDTRIRILNLLLERECCVCEVMQVLDISQTRASRNLHSLYDAGFVQQRRENLWVVYYIDSSSGLSAELVDLLKGHLNQYDVMEKDLERLREANRFIL